MGTSYLDWLNRRIGSAARRVEPFARRPEAVRSARYELRAYQAALDMENKRMEAQEKMDYVRGLLAAELARGQLRPAVYEEAEKILRWWGEGMQP